MSQIKINTLSTPFSSKPYMVITKKANMLTVCDDDKSYVTRNVSFFKKVNMYNCRVCDPIPITPMLEMSLYTITILFNGVPFSNLILTGMYFGCILMMTSLSVTFTVLVLIFHHRTIETHVMPRWVTIYNIQSCKGYTSYPSVYLYEYN